MADLRFCSDQPLIGGTVSGDGDFRSMEAEDTAAQVLRTIHPTMSSERKRALVISYVQRLLGCSLGSQVFPYGSVPLKTYLPDGDIDLTVLTDPNTEDTLISDIFDVLKQEELNEYAVLEVKDVQLISAEVKLVKCLIQNIVVDISCNQLGGLCTLCFLEQIDRLVDTDHLFKHSIILIKAWCYYESRILGATHGLFSTYALEILVLYIFQMYHSSLKGPLSVLYSFLDYFSKFDWENYCVSLHGPVCKASLPDIVVHIPKFARHSMLMSKQFLTNSTSMFKVPPKDLGKQSRSFQPKFISIIDPLKEDNNLGRSVHQGNSLRIQSAMKFAARQLDKILSLPIESIREELKTKFFRNTMARHGGRFQPSSQPLSSRSTSSSLQSSDVDSSKGVRSPRAETEGTSDTSSQASDSSSYHVDISIQADQPTDIPSDSAKWGENSCETLLNSPSANEVGADKCRELKGICIIRETMENTLPVCNHHGNTHLVDVTPKLSTTTVSPGHQSLNVSVHNEVSKHLDPFSDLNGDYESHLKSLFYGQSFHGNATILPMLYNVSVWDMHQKLINFGHDHHFQMNPNYAMWGQQFPQVRGTGTYIPRTDLGSWKGGKLPPMKRGRRSTQGRSPTFQSCHNDNKFSVGMIPFQVNVSEPYHQKEFLKPMGTTAYPYQCEQSEGLELSFSENLQEEKDERDMRTSDDILETERIPKQHVMRIPDRKLVDGEDSLKSVGGHAYQLKDEADFPPLASEVAIRRSIST